MLAAWRVRLPSGFGIRTPQNGVYEEGVALVGHDRDG